MVLGCTVQKKVAMCIRMKDALNAQWLPSSILLSLYVNIFFNLSFIHVLKISGFLKSQSLMESRCHGSEGIIGFGCQLINCDRCSMIIYTASPSRNHQFPLEQYIKVLPLPLGETVD